MKLKVPVALLSIGCVFLSTEAKTVLGVVATPPLRTTRVKLVKFKNEKKITIRCTFPNCMFTKGRSV